MQREYALYFKSRYFFQNALHLHSVFADYAEIIPPRLASPILVGIARAELSESVRRKQRLVGFVIRHYYFGPMNHRSGDEFQRMRSEFESRAVADNDLTVGKIRAEELFHHNKRLLGRGDLRVRILLREKLDIRRMVGFHMLNDQIIGRSAVKRGFKVTCPLLSEIFVHGVKYGDFLVLDDVRIVRHTVRYVILSLEKVKFAVIDPDVLYTFCNIHTVLLSFVIFRLADLQDETARTSVRTAVRYIL